MLKKPFLIITILFLAGGVLFVFGMALHRAFEPIAVKNSIVTRPEDPDRFNEVAMKLPGRKDSYWDLRVEKTENKSGVGLLYNVKGNYYRGSQMICRISGRSGRVNWDQGAMTITGDVELVSADGKRVSADTVTWDPAPERITAIGHVRYDGPGVSVITEELTTDLSFAKVKSKGNTNTKLIITDNK